MKSSLLLGLFWACTLFSSFPEDNKIENARLSTSPLHSEAFYSYFPELSGYDLGSDPESVVGPVVKAPSVDLGKCYDVFPEREEAKS